MSPTVKVVDQSSDVVRVCAADLRPLTPKQRVYCSDACKQLVRLWRIKAALKAARS